MNTFQQGHALLVGIANYRNINSLPSIVIDDVDAVAQLLHDTNRCGYPRDQVQTLVDSQATKEAILRELANLAKCCTSDSTALIYLSGHGGRIEEGPNAGEYLLPFDTNLTQSQSGWELTPESAISNAEFTNCLQQIPADRLVVILDCCHAAGTATLKTGSGLKLKTLELDFYDSLAQGTGRVIFASSKSDEVSTILPGATHSLFTEVLLEGLRGKAATQGSKGAIRVLDLQNFILEELPKRYPNQHPIFSSIVQDNFAIALHQNLVSEQTPRADGPDATAKMEVEGELVHRAAFALTRLVNQPSLEARINFEKKRLFPSQGQSGGRYSTLIYASINPVPTANYDYYFQNQFAPWITERDTYLDTYARLLTLHPMLLNEGKLPSTNVQLVLDFSDVGIPVWPRDLPERPKRPKPPTLASTPYFDSSAFAGLGLADRLNRSLQQRHEAAPLKIKGSTVEWEVSRLQHGRNFELEPLPVLVNLPEAEAMTYEVPFSIFANEFADPKTGSWQLDLTFQQTDFLDAVNRYDAEEAERD